MRARILAGLAPSNNLAREVKEPDISEIETESAEDLRLERDTVNFVCLSFILADFFVDLDNIDIVFLRLASGLRGRDRVSEDFLLLLLLSIFLLLIFSLLALVIIIISVASRNNIFLEKASI